MLQINLPCGPFGYPLAIRVWREAWEALRRHTDRDISETNSIHNTLAHLEEYYDLTKESLVKVSILHLFTSTPHLVPFFPNHLLTLSPSFLITFPPNQLLTSSPSNLITISPHHFLTPRLFTFSPPHQTSDHVVEQAHQWLHQTLTKTNCVVKDLESPVHGERLFRGVMRHNGTIC